MEIDYKFYIFYLSKRQGIRFGISLLLILCILFGIFYYHEGKRRETNEHLRIMKRTFDTEEKIAIKKTAR